MSVNSIGTPSNSTPVVVCAVCGDVRQAGGKPVKMMSLPAEVRWQEAPNPQAAWALVRKARAKGISQTEHVLCSRCARLSCGA
jgi:hypothetical protein